MYSKCTPLLKEKLMPKVSSIKESRLQIRVNSESRRVLERAAAYSNKNISEFILSHMMNTAEKIVEKHENSALSAEDWDIFYKALLNPPKPNKKLKKAFKTYCEKK